MKKIFLISGILIMFSCKKENDKKSVSDSFASNNLNSRKTDSIKYEKNLSSLDAIKKEYNLVNLQLLAKKLDSVSFEYECEERSGNVVYYSENGSLKVIKHFQADSHFSSTEKYFVNNGQPYFIFKDDTVWSFDGGTSEKPQTKDDVTEERFYIVDNRLVQCLEKQYTLKSNSSNNPKSENIPNKEMKNCSITELQKTFDLLIKNKDKRENKKCL